MTSVRDGNQRLAFDDRIRELAEQEEALQAAAAKAEQDARQKKESEPKSFAEQRAAFQNYYDGKGNRTDLAEAFARTVGLCPSDRGFQSRAAVQATFDRLNDQYLRSKWLTPEQQAALSANSASTAKKA